MRGLPLRGGRGVSAPPRHAPPTVQLGGLLGAALAANRHGRLSHFIIDPDSPAIAMFAPGQRLCNREGDWYGEHAGKWLVAATRAAVRADDATLAARVCAIARYLADTQEPDGYLGTYARERRFMRAQPPKPASWDGAPSVRTWDIWTHAYLILGLLEVHRHFPDPVVLQAARRIGELCWATLAIDGFDITALGNHHGMSATVLMDPAMELHFATGEQRFLDLALLIFQQANQHPELSLLSRALEGADASTIATGKAYQLLWNLVGVAKLHRATGDPAQREAVETLWRNIRDRHLTLGGGPWGGVGLRSREVFNPAGVFSPHGYVETCSTLAWIQLNRELLALTGEARYAEEIERSAYNDLIGAQAADGEDWCYYSFPNGRRVHTTYWRCCKSSGAMALEELPGVAYSGNDGGGLDINLLGPGRVAFQHPVAGEVVLEQVTSYPHGGDVWIGVGVQAAALFTLRLRVPSWAQGATLHVNGEPWPGAMDAGHFVAVDRVWHAGDELQMHLPMRPIAHRATHRNVQKSRAPDGSEVRQEVQCEQYLAITRGPLVYATGLIDGFKSSESLLLPDQGEQHWLAELPPRADGAAPRIELRPLRRNPIEFEPYFSLGGRADGAWRLTWMPLAPALLTK